MERLKLLTAGVAVTLGSMSVGESVRAESASPTERYEQVAEIEDQESSDSLTTASKIALGAIIVVAPSAIAIAYRLDKRKRIHNN